MKYLFAIALAVLALLACSEDDPLPPEEAPANLHGIGGWTEFDLYAVGQRGSIFNYRGIEWRPVASPVSSTLRDVIGFSPTSAFAVGDDGVILRLNGTRFERDTSPVSVSLASLWGSSPA